MEQTVEKIKLTVKKYLELENVSFLFGAGSTFHLGAPVIRTIPEELKEQCQTEITEYFGDGADPSYEDLYNCLQADHYLKDKKGERQLHWKSQWRRCKNGYSKIVIQTTLPFIGYMMTILN